MSKHRSPSTSTLKSVLRARIARLKNRLQEIDHTIALVEEQIFSGISAVDEGWRSPVCRRSRRDGSAMGQLSGHP